MNISFLDANFTQICDPIDDFSSLSYTKTGNRWEEHGEFKLVMNPDHFATVFPAKYVAFDGLVFNVTNRKTTDADADGQMSLSGYSLNVLFDRVALTDVTRLAGNLETQIRSLVTAYAITGYQSISGLTLGSLAGYTAGIDATTYRGSLASFLYTELNARGFSWSITHSGEGLVFDILQGLDRTQEQDTNTPALFSSAEENIENVEYEQSETEYFNVAAVCDEDEVSPKTVFVDQSNGEEKRVMYVSGRGARDESATDQVFVMCGYGKILTSANGSSFTERYSDAGGYIYSSSYGGWKYLAAHGNYLITSSDAVTWTSRNITKNIKKVLYKDGVIIGTDLTQLFVSYDALSFEEIAIPDSAGMYAAPIFTGVRYFIPTSGKYSGITNFAYIESKDIYNWIEHVITVPSSVYYNTTVNASAMIGELAVCVGFANSPSSIRYPFIAIGNPETEVWSFSILTAYAGTILESVATGNNRIVAVSRDNKILQSSDYGATWANVTPSATGTPDYISVVFDGTYFHAYSANTKHHAVTNSSGAWSAATIALPTVEISHVFYANYSKSFSLEQIGANALANSRVIDLLDCDVLPGAPEVGADCNLGDIVDIAHPKRGIIVSKRLIDAQAIAEPHNHTIKPKFGTNYLSMKKYIKKEINNRV